MSHKRKRYASENLFVHLGEVGKPNARKEKIVQARKNRLHGATLQINDNERHISERSAAKHFVCVNFAGKPGCINRRNQLNTIARIAGKFSLQFAKFHSASGKKHRLVFLYVEKRKAVQTPDEQ